jgi:hypothetical protein
MRASNISNVPVTSTPIRTVSGRSLVHWKLTKRDKRRLALEILAGHVSVTAFTVRQAAALVGLDVDYIRTTRNGGNGGNGHRPEPKPPSLADMLAKASPDERAEAAARLGPAVIWDSMVAPLIDEERTSQAAE